MHSDDPEEVGLYFIKRVDDLVRHHQDLLMNVQGKLRQASLETILAEQMAMSIGIYWEAFVHDLIIAYVADEPSACVRNYGAQMKQSIGERFPGAVGWLDFDLPFWLTPYQVERVLNPKGRNVTASSASGLRDLANKHLIARHAKRFALGAEDAEFVDFLVRLRNYLGHRSRESRNLLVRAIKNFSATGANRHLKGPTNNLGVYLKGKSAGMDRISAIAARTKNVATLISP
jgi:hypothetical protein